MALPGLSFEIVRTAPPVGFRADQTALLALTERGPLETPIAVHSFDEFTTRFGAILPGTLGALAAKAYYDNGGELLVVTRFAPAEASSAIGALPVVGVDPARTGRMVVGQLEPAGAATIFIATALTPSLLPSDVNTPIFVSAGGATVPATITSIVAGGSAAIIATGAPAAGFPPVLPATCQLVLPATVPLVADGPGAFGNGVRVQITLSLRRRAQGTLAPAGSPNSFQLTALTPSVLSSDAGAPARLVAGTVASVQWGTITSVGSDGSSLFFASGPATPGFPPASATTAVIEVYDPTFTLTILEAARASVVVSGLDLRHMDDARARLSATSVTIPPIPGEVPLPPGAPLPPPELPVAGVVSLYGGTDGLSALAPDATSATATIAVVNVTPHAPPFALPLVATAPGAQANGIVVDTSLTVRKFTLGQIGAVEPDGSLHVHGLHASDEGFPVQIVAEPSGTTLWGTVVAAATGHAHHRVVFVPGAPSPPLALPQQAAIRVYEPTFSLTVTPPGKPALSVSGLDLRDLESARALLTVTPVTIPTGAVDSMGLELPEPGSVTLGGGSDGSPLPFRIENLAASFQRCTDALELVATADLLPDIVVAPDLSSAIWGTKGEQFLHFDAATAIALADQLVLSAWRTSDRVVIVDPPLRDDLHPYTPAELVEWRAQRYDALGPAGRTGALLELISVGTDFAATFTPWVQIVAGGRYRNDDTLLLPPSAFVAGRMARTSRERGPWVATGNVSLEGVVGLDQRLGVQDQESLQGAGISPLRVELPQGATIQGVRSLSWPDRPDWGYLATRRLFNFLRRSLVPIGLSYVFEPNTPQTWAALRRDLVRVLRDVFLAGGLAGSKPSDAFYVKIDDTINPPPAVDAGIITAEIGVAPAIPLEFLVVRLIVQDNTAKVAEAPP
jgi:hypothetical protein